VVGSSIGIIMDILLEEHFRDDDGREGADGDIFVLCGMNADACFRFDVLKALVVAEAVIRESGTSSRMFLMEWLEERGGCSMSNANASRFQVERLMTEGFTQDFSSTW